MGNQHLKTVQDRVVIEKYETEEKVSQHFNSRDDTWIITYPNNDEKGREIYRGQMKDGLRHGQGMLLWKNGATYDGEWYQDHIEGQWGTMTWPDSRIYTGSWKNGFRDGVGVLTVPEYGGGTKPLLPFPLLAITYLNM